MRGTVNKNYIENPAGMEDGVGAVRRTASEMLRVDGGKRKRRPEQTI
jgi:hypothetical protein